MKTEDVSPYGEAVKLAEKHGGVWGHDQSKLYIFDQPQLAALIAEVRRQTREEDAGTVESVANLDAGNPYKQALRLGADAIRARLDSPSGKEEGK